MQPGKDEELTDADELWHELVLAGVGGRTIQEAQQRISYPEFMQWVKYRGRRGSLNIGRRVEESTALLATMYHNAHSKKTRELKDFMPHYYEGPITAEQAMKSWT